MKYCSSCGRKLEDQVKFCSGCGAKQETFDIIAAEKPIPKESREASPAHEKICALGMKMDEVATLPHKQAAKPLKLLYVVIGISIVLSIVWWLVSRNTSTPKINSYQLPASKSPIQPPPIREFKIDDPKTLDSNAALLNQEINQIIAARQAWFNSKNFSFTSKAPITTGVITNAQMSDNTYPTPLEAKQMKEWIDFRQDSYKKIDKAISQYEPLSSLMKSSLALNKEMANKYAASTYNLINGKLSYGEFNRIRRDDGIWYEKSRLALEKTQTPATKQEIKKNSQEVIF